MNFKDWEKLSEDKSSVVLQHPKGHTMTIAMRALPKIQQEQIKRLNFAKGGKVERKEGMSEQGRDVRYANKIKKKELPSVYKNDPQGDKAMGMAREEAKGRAEMEREVKPKLKGLAEGTPDGDVGDQVQKDDQAPPPVTVNVVNPQGGQPPPMVAQAPPERGQAMTPYKPPTPAVIEGAQPQVPGPGGTVNAEAQRTLQGVNQGKQAIQAQAQIDAAKAKALTPAMEESLQKEQELANQNMNAYKEIAQHSDDFKKYIDENPINPKHYQESMGSGQKVGTAIGLFLGGFGTPFGGHNYAFDFLNKQIDRDIEAQQKRADNQKTVLGAYQNLYGYNKIAMDLAKASMNDIYAKKIQLAGAQLGTAQAAQAAQAATAKLDQDSHDLRMRAAGALGGQRTQGDTPQSQPGSGKAEPEGRYKILAPGAEGKYNQIMQGLDPMWSPKSDLINQQYTSAQQAEKVLNGPKGDGTGGIHDILSQMHQASDKMGYYGYGHEKVGQMASELPLVGGAAGAAVNLLPPTQSEKRYQALQSSLETDLATALNGLMTPSDIHALVKKYSPSYQDTEKDVKFKEEQIANSIRKAIRSSGLKATGMVHD